jgi:hypothetical protein
VLLRNKGGILKEIFWVSILVLLIIFFTLPIIGLILGFIQGLRVDNDWEKQNKDANIIRQNR